MSTNIATGPWALNENCMFALPPIEGRAIVLLQTEIIEERIPTRL